MTIYLLIAITVAVLLDGSTTYYALSRPGAAEGNPLVRALINAFGLAGGLLLSRAGVIAALWVFAPDEALLMVVLAVYAAVVGWNLRVINNQQEKG